MTDLMIIKVHGQALKSLHFRTPPTLAQLQSAIYEKFGIKDGSIAVFCQGFRIDAEEEMGRVDRARQVFFLVEGG
jgi:hypothetical protein